MIGCPNDGASLSRTVRGTMLWQTLSPKWSRTSCTTWSASLVRASYMTSTMALSSSRGFRFFCTSCTLRSSWPRPSRA